MFENKEFDIRPINSMEKVQIELFALNKVTSTVLSIEREYPSPRIHEMQAYTKRLLLLRDLIASKGNYPKI